jgi:hypothetical protein
LLLSTGLACTVRWPALPHNVVCKVLWAECTLLPLSLPEAPRAQHCIAASTFERLRSKPINPQPLKVVVANIPRILLCARKSTRAISRLWVCRLQALPAMPLQEVARRAGLPSRLLSKQLLEAYGPLQGGLRLQRHTPTQLLHILRHQCTRLRGITALELRDPLILRQGPDVHMQHLAWQRQQQELAAAIAAAFPNLRSLDLRDTAPLVVAWGYSDEAVAALQPLGSCLTSLTLPVEPGPGASTASTAPRALRAFSALRCLHISIFDMRAATRREPVAPWLECVACMPSLTELDLQTLWGPGFSARLWLPGLARVAPQLTSLGCHSTHDWDAAALSVLRRGLPALKSLSLKLPERDADGPAWLGAILAALSRRTGLTSLALGCPLRAWALQQPVPAALQLAGCKVDMREHDGGEQTVLWLLEALAAQTGLTRLRVTLPRDGHADTAAVLYSSLRSMAPTLVNLGVGCIFPAFDAALLMACTARHARLEALVLTDADLGGWPAEAAEKLEAMTRLQVLRLHECSIPDALLQSLASLTQLRHLCLEDYEGGAGSFSDASLPYLQPLQQLTYLQLASPARVAGPGLMALRQLTALRRLGLVLTRAAVMQLHRWLLPLPPSLRTLSVGAEPYTEHVVLHAALVAAAKAQGCIIE